jgi:hypothetical protein
MKAILPFELKYTPISELALINFEKKKPDTIYKGLELQYIDGEDMGKGYRVIAYRNDAYVDVYDEKTIKYIPEEKFDVAQKGLKQHVQRQFENTGFYKEDGNVHISFTFMDCDNRKIEVDIKEHAKNKSIPMNLLAPIGYSSERPICLPVFFLYNFDFVRRSKTDCKILIDGRRLKLDPFPFPVPMNMQWRYYTRYSLDCQILEFLNTDSGQVKTVELKEELNYAEGAVEYRFEENNGDMALSMICINDVRHPLRVEFQPPMSFVPHKGEFHIKPEAQMGSIDGSYQVSEEGDHIRIEVVPDQGWRSVPNSRITKLILGEKSIFCNWSKKYSYVQKLNRNNLSTEAKWTNFNITSQDK